MKYAVISDIHGNLRALNAMLEDMQHGPGISRDRFHGKRGRKRLGFGKIRSKAHITLNDQQFFSICYEVDTIHNRKLAV